MTWRIIQLAPADVRLEDLGSLRSFMEQLDSLRIWASTFSGVIECQAGGIRLAAKEGESRVLGQPLGVAVPTGVK